MLQKITDYLYVLLGVCCFIWVSHILYNLFNGTDLFVDFVGREIQYESIAGPVFLLRMTLVFIDRKLGNTDNHYI